ncbi:MAG: hypothetical protein H7039_22620 [Bryobacteraceae bacterium]|nr:hypothetical protein [Bryobacteraceae bacterium]
MLRNILVLLAFILVVSAEGPPIKVPVEISHDKGSFAGVISVEFTGNMSKARFEWNATLRNTSSHQIYRVTFCGKAYDASGQQIRPGDQDCVLRLWANNWQPGSPMVFKGKQSIRSGDGKAPIQVAKFELSAVEVFDHSPNLRHLTTGCPLVWSSALKVFADRKFRPTVMDKGSYTATFAFDGGRVDSALRTT